MRKYWTIVRQCGSQTVHLSVLFIYCVLRHVLFQHHVMLLLLSRMTVSCLVSALRRSCSPRWKVKVDKRIRTQRHYGMTYGCRGFFLIGMVTE